MDAQIDNYRIVVGIFFCFSAQKLTAVQDDTRSLQLEVDPKPRSQQLQHQHCNIIRTSATKLLHYCNIDI